MVVLVVAVAATPPALQVVMLQQIKVQMVQMVAHLGMVHQMVILVVAVVLDKQVLREQLHLQMAEMD